MSKAVGQQDLQTLYELLAKVTEIHTMEAFLNDLCTRKEIENMAERIRAAKLLMEGKTYAQVIEQTEISSATLSRISQCVRYGKGYSELLERKEKS